MSRRLRDKDAGWKDVIGMPDDWDKRNMTTLINNFMNEKFTMPDGTIKTGKQWFLAEKKDAIKQHQLENPFNERGVKIKDSDTQVKTAIPSTLWQRMSDTMPTVFTYRPHFEWFLKNFPAFKITQK